MAGVAARGQVAEAEEQVVAVRADQGDAAFELGARGPPAARPASRSSRAAAVGADDPVSPEPRPVARPVDNVPRYSSVGGRQSGARAA